ncbi:MAG: ComEC/Rec2 family competence protein [Neomegalonema sp.]
MAELSGLSKAMATSLRAERGRLALWTPVALGGGAWTYFAILGEPPWWLGGGLVAVCGLLLFACTRFAGASGVRIGAAALFLLALGFAVAQARAWHVAAPIWSGDTRSAQQLNGRIFAIDRSRSGAPRLTLEHVTILGVSSERTPHRVRATFFDAAAETIGRFQIGDRIRILGRLSPPPGPAEPGACDFRRKAWFERLGALAVVRAPPNRAAPEQATGWDAARLARGRLRARISNHVQTQRPDQIGAVIAALLVGDRSGLSAETVDSLRDANLAHLLAISGLHMGLISITAFGVVRFLLALHPWTSSAIAGKKAAAIAALAVATAYLALSGATIPTQRAFLMAVVAFGGVLLDRPAVTLRAGATAATLILLWRPESLFDAGFQLSFAAATAMVAFFEATRPVWIDLRRRPSLRRRMLSAVGALSTSSLIAGLATAPFSAFLFNRVARYGLIANLAAVPLMGALVMPAGLAALLLMPFGLEAPALDAMALGVWWIMKVAETVAAWPGSVSLVASGPNAALALIAFGGLQICLHKAPWLRAVGLVPVVLGGIAWTSLQRPALLIAPEGRLVGVQTDMGRAVDRPRGASYAAGLWSRRDGDGSDQSAAADRWPRHSDGVTTSERTAPLPAGWRLRVWLQRTPYDGALIRRCAHRTVLVLPRAEIDDAQRKRVSGRCLLLDRSVFRRSGALALSWRGPSPTLTSAADVAGRRLWTTPGFSTYQ